VLLIVDSRAFSDHQPATIFNRRPVYHWAATNVNKRDIYHYY